MKVSEEDRNRLKETAGDPEVSHGFYDDLMEARLRELDPEYMDDLDKMKDEFELTFWYA